MRAILIVLSCLSSVFSVNVLNAQAQSTQQVIREYTSKHGAKILQSLKSFVELPNVSADQNNIRVNAEYLVNEFTKRGAKMEMLEVPGANPVVYGELNSPNAKRTIVIYAHFDGQPVNEARWNSTRPFKPALYAGAVSSGAQQILWPQPGDEVQDDWRVYGRSTSDDKAPFIALLTALDAMRESRIPITSNIKFFFDGEEEIGSPNMRRVLDQHAAKFKDVDLWAFCDGPMHQSRKPTLYYGVRGITGLEITVYGAARNLHSGHYGNWAPNPGLMLSQLLASMKDENGYVVIPGFYDDVVPLSKTEQAALDAVPPIDVELRHELGLVESENKNQPYLERMQLPSLNIKGIECGTVGKKARNIVPNQATATIDIRLVKGTMPRRMEQLVRDFVKQQGYTIIDSDPVMSTRREHKKLAKITSSIGYPAARTSMDHPQVKPLVSQLETFLDGEQLLQVPSIGGSLPLYLISDYLNQPLVIVSMANHDNNQHAPDENLRVGNLKYGILAMSALLTMDE